MALDQKGGQALASAVPSRAYALRLALAACRRASAVAALAGSAAAQPRDVEVGAFVTSISDINPDEGTFRIAFYVWVNDPAGRFDLERDVDIIARDVTISELEVEAGRPAGPTPLRGSRPTSTTSSTSATSPSTASG